MGKDEQKTDAEDKSYEMNFTNKMKMELIHIFPHIFKNYTVAKYIDGKKEITKIDKLKNKDKEELAKIVYLFINESNPNLDRGSNGKDSSKEIYKELRTITFGDNVKNITGDFSHQPKLEKIIFGKSIETIGEDGDGIFRESHQLRKVDFSRASNLKIIGSGAFFRCAIEELDFPNSIEEMGNYAFGDNGSNIWVKGGIVKMPNNLKKIGVGAFRHTDLQGVLFADGSFYGDPEDYLRIPKIEKNKAKTYPSVSIVRNSFNEESNYGWFTTDSFFNNNQKILWGQKVCKIEKPAIAKKIEELRRYVKMGIRLEQKSVIEDDRIGLRLYPLKDETKETEYKNDTPTSPEKEY